MTPLDLQFYNLFVMVLAGVALGLCFDTYRVIRRILRPGWMATALGDLIFGLACGLILAAALVVGNWIQLRLYVFVGVLAGLALYLELAGETYRRGLGAAFTLIRRLLLGTVRLVGQGLALTAVILLLFLQPFFWLAGTSVRVAAWLGRPLTVLVSPLARLAERAWGPLRRLAAWPAGLWRSLGRKRE